ncbi:NUDIX hydrolase [Paenibacillus guangzhouensis]|uniref:NUDIX hydrolase n=1 Tax=Paenibacillus guangzhouensis TaxID=1473112 RepID=UPI001266A85A|nr:NUDIX hydrolase [Paenibacillus guangzhouensis]
MKRVNVASVLIHDEQGRILVVQNGQGTSSYWSLPGGEVEEGETLEQGAIREAKEETGYDIAITGLNSLREMYFTARESHALIITFTAIIIGGSIQLQDPDQDIVDVRWVDVHTAKELMPDFIERFRLNTDHDKSLAFYAFEGVKP